MTSLPIYLLALTGTPLFIVIAALALLSFHRGGIDLTVVFIEMYRLAETPTLTAIPLFAFTGFLLAESKAADRLVRFSEALLGWLPGGLGIMATVVCALFTAFTGASGMTIIALGGLLYPALIKQGYNENFSLGLLTTSGSLGLLFPPSIPLIIYALVANTPINQLFLAGIMPGLLLVGAVSLYCLIAGTRSGSTRKPYVPGDCLRVLREGAWELLLPVVVLGGVFGGFIAVSEAAALSTVYILLVEVVVHREISLRQLPGIMCNTMVLVGSIFVIMASAMGYTNYLIDAEIPNQLLDVIKQHVTSPLSFLILLNLFLLAVGCMIDMFSALLVIVPLILPISEFYKIDPVHLGIIFLTNLEIGYSTPPVGLNLFVSSMRFEKPILKLYWASLPFLFILFGVLLLITYIPALSLFLVAS